MLLAYMDESGHSGDSKIVSLGGFIGNHMLATFWQHGGRNKVRLRRFYFRAQYSPTNRSPQ